MRQTPIRDRENTSLFLRIKEFCFSRQFDIYLAIYLICSSLYDVIVSYIYLDEFVLYWYCDFVGLLLGVALLFRLRVVYNFVLVSVIPAQFLWILDFFIESFGDGLGRTAALYSYGLPVFVGSVNLHAILIPASLFLTYKYGFDKRSFWYGFFFIAGLLSFAFFFTEPYLNVNCVFFSCDGAYSVLDQSHNFTLHFLKTLLFWLFMYSVAFVIHCFIWDTSLREKIKGQSQTK
jgi:hypothetical protein